MIDVPEPLEEDVSGGGAGVEWPPATAVSSSRVEDSPRVSEFQSSSSSRRRESGRKLALDDIVESDEKERKMTG